MKSFRETKRSLRDLVNVPSGFDYSTLWFSFPCAEKKRQIIKRQPTNTWCTSTPSPFGRFRNRTYWIFQWKKIKKRITLPILWLWKIRLFLRVRFKKFIWFFRGVSFWASRYNHDEFAMNSWKFRQLFHNTQPFLPKNLRQSEYESLYSSSFHSLLHIIYIIN